DKPKFEHLKLTDVQIWVYRCDKRFQQIRRGDSRIARFLCGFGRAIRESPLQIIRSPVRQTQI
ncbi:MAG: hypothetical protein IJW99_04440, partial [Clostridia bacterium]|nr:hypothetical protein [Clostridia bacterium]